MSMRDKQDDHLDTLIDDTARAMTAAPPSPTLRSAVRRRIERRTPVLWTWRAGLAAASIVLVAVVVGRAWLSVTSEREWSRPAAVQDVVAANAPAAAGSTVPALMPDTPRAVVRPVAARPLPLPSPIAVEPIVVEPVSAEPVEIELIEVPMPLRAERVTIERLTFE
jgi:hypothetical protein